MSDLTTWRAELAEAMEAANDEGPVLSYAPAETAFDVQFDPEYGGSYGPPVLAWTASRVYFPVVYGSAEWISSAPRDPAPEGQEHVGGQ